MLVIALVHGTVMTFLEFLTLSIHSSVTEARKSLEGVEDEWGSRGAPWEPHWAVRIK